MLSLTQLLDTPIRTPDGAEIARLRDVVVRVTPPPGATVPSSDSSGSHPSPASDEPYPLVVGLATSDLEPAEGEGDVCFIPWARVARLTPEGAELRAAGAEFAAFAPRDGELALRAGLLERYVVDLAGGRLVRVNDVALDDRDGALRLVAVDASAGALLRRLGLGGLGERLLARISRSGPAAQQPSLLDWQRVVPLVEGGEADGQPAGWVRAKAARLNTVDPAELAEVLEGLTPRQAGLLLSAMDPRHAADTVEEMEDERQAQALRAMDRERAADVLDEMDPDEATDALQALREMDTAEAADLMDRMEREEAEEVQELSAYPPDTAGGLMTTDFVAVAGDITAGALLDALRARAAEAAAGEAEPVPEALTDMYVVEERPEARADGAAAVSGASRVRLDAEGRLVGVLGLRELVLARLAAPLASIMRAVDEVAAPLDDARTVARTIADADLMALPVVDEAGELLGIVTVDDAIDVILPSGWRGRPLRRPH